METDSNTFICPDGFTEDLLVEILKRLPAKSLFRFRCVCKSWNSLIASSDFIISHGLSSRSDDDLQRSFLVSAYSTNGISYALFDPRVSLAEHSRPEFIRLPFQILRVYQDWRTLPEVVKDVIHGVVCLSDLHPRHNPIVLWNPAIRKLVEVPPPPWIGSSRYWPSTALGFGFVGTKTSRRHCYDFKVVRIVASDHPFQYHRKPVTCEVFSIRQGGWRKVVARPHIEPFSIVTYSGCYANGSIHWLISNINEDYYDTMLLAFDCEREEFKTIPFLRKRRSFVWEANVFTYRGLLCVLIERGNELWAMEEYGVARSWKKLRNVCRGDDFVRIEAYQLYHYRRRGDPLPISWWGDPQIKKLRVKEALMGHVLGESLFLMDVNGKAIHEDGYYVEDGRLQDDVVSTFN